MPCTDIATPSGNTAISKDLVATYLETAYRVFLADTSFVLRIGQYSTELACLFGKQNEEGAVFITAENPLSKNMSATDNEAALERLRMDLQLYGGQIFCGSGEGSTPSWPAEASFLAFISSRHKAEDLGRKYQQNAILWSNRDAIPRLVLLR